MNHGREPFPRVLVAGTALLFLLSCKAAPQEPRRPDFTLPLASGGVLQLSRLRGKIVYVDFWATWCGPCIDAIPSLNELYARRKDQGLALVGVSVDGVPMEKLLPYVEKYKIAYPVVLGSEELMLDFGPAQGLPTGFLLDREGVVRRKFVGEVTLDALDQAVGELLAEPRKANN